MSWEGLSVLAVVPARGGSKGIPRKNLRTVGGESLIAHAAKVIRSLQWIDQAVLTTDDHEMAEEGRTHGLDVPFMRPDVFASDEAPALGMWQHAWLQSEAHYQRRFDLSLLLQPTTPLRKPEEVERTVRELITGNHQAAATISRVPGHFTPHKLLTLDSDHRLHFYLEDGAKHSLRQSIPSYYSRNGLCYAVRREHLIDNGMIVERDCVGVLIDRYVVNIDEPFELDLANILYQRQESHDEST
ncbi:MAG: acylneuraminate cytidylyltransferase family protein [Nitrospirales bacterium]|nr:acylneuraminate cytidylyltransferase family protein [Nitrospira sp.]MDR4503145.1 acylneuraminate cytidylyltransferase family protein [Nitrospirales bacterium]